MTNIEQKFIELLKLYKHISEKDTEFQDLYMNDKVFLGIRATLAKINENDLLNLLIENNIKDFESFFTVVFDMIFLDGSDFCYFIPFTWIPKEFNFVKEILEQKKLHLNLDYKIDNVDTITMSKVAQSILGKDIYNLTDTQELSNIIEETTDKCDGNYTTLRTGGNKYFISILLSGYEENKKRHSFYIYTGTNINILLIAYI